MLFLGPDRLVKFISIQVLYLILCTIVTSSITNQYWSTGFSLNYWTNRCSSHPELITVFSFIEQTWTIRYIQFSLFLIYTYKYLVTIIRQLNINNYYVGKINCLVNLNEELSHRKLCY